MGGLEECHFVLDGGEFLQDVIMVGLQGDCILSTFVIFFHLGVEFGVDFGDLSNQGGFEGFVLLKCGGELGLDGFEIVGHESVGCREGGGLLDALVEIVLEVLVFDWIDFRLDWLNVDWRG